MPIFRCSICGENFPGQLLGQDDLVGFYTTRYVDADTPEQAEHLALELLRDDPSLELAPEHRTPNAKVYFERIDEIPANEQQEPNAGFVFFTMGT
jgi:hypothetical protein